jgi:hypothetical protein
VDTQLQHGLTAGLLLVCHQWHAQGAGLPPAVAMMQSLYILRVLNSCGDTAAARADTLSGRLLVPSLVK